MLVLSKCAVLLLLEWGLGSFLPVTPRGGQLADLSPLSSIYGSTQSLAERMQVVASLSGHRDAHGCVQGQWRTRAAASSFPIHFREVKRYPD